MDLQKHRALYLDRQTEREPPARLPIRELTPPFGAGMLRAGDGRFELAHFAHIARDLEPLVANIPRLELLRKEYSLYGEFVDAEAVRIFFGGRYTYRFVEDSKGSATLPWKRRWKVVTEHGPQLIYSVGPDGTIAIMLFPATSALASPIEEVIFLGIARFSAGQLAARVKSDLKRLAAYGHVTSIDGSPTLVEQLTVWWLRTFNPTTTRGEFRRAQLSAARLGAVWLFATRTMFTAALVSLLRPLALIAVVWWLTKNWPDIAKLIPGHLS